MKRIMVSMVLALLFGLMSVAFAQEEGVGPPELETANNMKKKAEVWAPLIRAEKIVIKNFPGAYRAKRYWTIGDGGYSQSFWNGQGKGREEIGVILSFEGRVFYWVSESSIEELK